MALLAPVWFVSLLRLGSFGRASFAAMCGQSLLEGRSVGARCAQMARVLLLSSGMRTVRCHSSGVSWCQRLCWLLDERRKADAQGSEPASPERGGRRGQRAGAATSCEVGA